MSRNGGSDILVAAVATGSSLSIGLGSVLNQPSVRNYVDEMTGDAIEYVYKSTEKPRTAVSNYFRHMHESKTSLRNIFKSLNKPIQKERDTSSTLSKSNRNYPNSLLLIPECKHLENDQVDISQDCKDIYDASLLAVITERFQTKNQSSQEKLYQVALQAGEKRRRELIVVASVTTGTTVVIAHAAVADSAN